MRHFDGGGLAAKERAGRERVRLAAEWFEEAPATVSWRPGSVGQEALLKGLLGS
jgi:hypothetical protein